MSRHRVIVLLIALISLAIAIPTARAADVEFPETLLTPERHQIDIEGDDTYEFLTSNSAVRRRVNSSLDSTIRLGPDLGNDNMNLPQFLGTFWFNSENAAQFQFRYFANTGNNFSTTPFWFGGAKIAAGQKLDTGGTRWFTFGGFYERRLTPWYQDRESNLPSFLQGWDLRAKVGLEFTYNDFRINDGSPNFDTFSQFEARIRFHEKGLPVPVLGMEARRWITPYLAFEATAQGYWTNKWNSGRSEGGTVYDSQSGFETNWRAFYFNPVLRGVSPFAGINYNYTKDAQSSSGVFNMLRVQMFGPTFGFNWSIKPLF
jgi:hypothetical protein